ncbi:hypothetical protein JB92DRAFT_3114304 [Gautieria morchelliformis]|nr:hypothetical protein JB92DRAFT_3114304 [Gautieria morchelliformis]
MEVGSRPKENERFINPLFGLQSVLEHARRLVEDAIDKNVSPFDRRLGAEGAQGEAGQGPWPQMPHALDILGKLQQLFIWALDVDQTRLHVEIHTGVEAWQDHAAKVGQSTERTKLGAPVNLDNNHQALTLSREKREPSRIARASRYT